MNDGFMANIEITEDLNKLTDNYLYIQYQILVNMVKIAREIVEEEGL
jgi:hypothetical protein